MSIINDALKKIQQGLNPKIEETKAAPPPAAQPAGQPATQPPSPFADIVPPEIEILPSQKLTIPKKLQSMLITACIILLAIAVAIASAEYIYHQVQNNVPKVENLAQKSFTQLVHRRPVFPFKKKAVPPLAKITIPPAAGSAPSTSQPMPPVTLDVHGIMANATGNVALINDQVYQEGDDVDGAKIVKIGLDSITVTINGVTKIIPVNN